MIRLITRGEAFVPIRQQIEQRLLVLGTEAQVKLRIQPVVGAVITVLAPAYLREQAALVPGVQQAVDRIAAPAGSEDATLMMARVQARGGLASYMIFGTELSAGHHNEKFDFDESVMTVAVDTLARVALNFPWQRGV